VHVEAFADLVLPALTAAPISRTRAATSAAGVGVAASAGAAAGVGAGGTEGAEAELGAVRLCVLDEVGKMELLVGGFGAAVAAVLDDPSLAVLGTLPAPPASADSDGSGGGGGGGGGGCGGGGKVAEAIRGAVEAFRSRGDVDVVEVTLENREALGPVVLAKARAALALAALAPALDAKRLLARRYWIEEVAAADADEEAAADHAAAAGLANATGAPPPPPPPPSARRVAFDSFAVAFRGDHGTYTVAKKAGDGPGGGGSRVTCTCPFFTACEAAAGSGAGTCSHVITLSKMLVE
jgi:hypothetical protein